jgi:hypothetical protein
MDQDGGRIAEASGAEQETRRGEQVALDARRRRLEPERRRGLDRSEFSDLHRAAGKEFRGSVRK